MFSLKEVEGRFRERWSSGRFGFCVILVKWVRREVVEYMSYKGIRWFCFVFFNKK